MISLLQRDGVSNFMDFSQSKAIADLIKDFKSWEISSLDTGEADAKEVIAEHEDIEGKLDNMFGSLMRCLGNEVGSVTQSASGDVAQVEVDAHDFGIQTHGSNDGTPEVLPLIQEKGVGADAAEVIPTETLTRTPIRRPEDVVERVDEPRVEDSSKATEASPAGTAMLTGDGGCS